MKKFLVIFASVIALAFTSCSKQNVKNEFGWYENYDSCLAQAKKSNKKVLLLISRDESDTVSSSLKEKIFHHEEFNKNFAENYELCEIDVSPNLFTKANPKKDAPKEVKRDSKKYKNLLDHRMRVVTIHNVQVTPTLYVLSNDGYVMAELTYIPVENVDGFAELLSGYDEEVLRIEALIDSVKKSSGLEKVRAIDTFYEEGNKKFRYQLTPLMREITSLDKKDESGLLGKYYLAIATSDAMDAYIDRKPEIVSDIYEKVAKNPALNKEQSQQAYYAAAYIVGSNTPTPEETVKLIDLLEKAISVDETSAIAERCKDLLSRVKEFQERQQAQEKKIQEESASVEE